MRARFHVLSLSFRYRLAYQGCFANFVKGQRPPTIQQLGKDGVLPGVDLLLIEGAADIALVQQHGDEAVDAVLQSGSSTKPVGIPLAFNRLLLLCHILIFRQQLNRLHRA